MKLLKKFLIIFTILFISAISYAGNISSADGGGSNDSTNGGGEVIAPAP